MTDERHRMRLRRDLEPTYAGAGATFAKLPLVLDPAGLAGVDVAILGAPIDEYVSNRPGARYGPRAIRLAGSPGSHPNMDLGVDPFEELVVVDYGDCEIRPGDPAWSHASLRRTVGEVRAAGAIPVILGGDHSIAHPDVGAVADSLPDGERVGLIHFDAHADNADEVWGVRDSHGTPLRRLVEEGSLDPHDILQIGLRGTWPGPETFAWAREAGFRWYLMDEVSNRGLTLVIDEVIEAARSWDHVFISFDIDVCDPAFAPGTGTPEPGGLTALEALKTVRRLALELGFIGMEVVEVSPPYDHAELTAMLGNRLVVEALSGLALHRSGREPRPERSA